MILSLAEAREILGPAGEQLTDVELARSLATLELLARLQVADDEAEARALQRLQRTA